MKKYMLILLLLIFSSCGSRKVNKSNVEETKKETTETHLIDTSKTVTNTNVQVKIIDTSTTSEVEVSPIDITKPFVYNGQTLNNAILRIKKHKNNISVVSDEKSSQIKRNAIVVDSKDKVESHTSIKKKDIDKKESILSYWWILLLIVAGYITYRKYIK
jgi:hypothetical protein